MSTIDKLLEEVLAKRGKLLGESQPANRIKNKTALDNSNLKAISSFDRWVSSHDLWHPNFPGRFAACLNSCIQINGQDSDFEDLGEMIADNCTSFYGDDMKKLVLFMKAHPELNDSPYEDILDAFNNLP